MITNPTSSDDNKSRRMLSSQNGGRIRDVSFSAFLDGTEETFILKLAEPQENLKSQNPNCPGENHNLASKKAEDNEIDVFNAEKYFNGRVEEDESPGFESKAIHQNTNDRHEYELSKSSSNRRSSLLLHCIPQTQQSHKSNRWWSINRKSFFSKLGCSCNDKNSVYIDVQEARTSSSCGGRKPEKAGDFSMKIDEPQTKSCVGEGKVGDPRIEDFRFPVVKSNRGEEEDDGDDGARKSLEVFGSPVSSSTSCSISGLSVERSRLKILTWDGIDIEIPSKCSRLYNVDSDSDASSDLFEIESLSTNPSSQYFTRQASDAPSVTSIDWSVVTASAADLAVMSDFEEPMTTNRGGIRTIKDNGGKTRRRSSILSGCYNNKAVMVAGDAHRTTGDQQVSTPSPRQH